jgi:hypothetical protein
MDLSDIIGKSIVGYRYGVAPECGLSWNYRDNCHEPGVSMAQVGYYREYSSFAISEAAEHRKRVYYIGIICGTGGDDEICLRDIKRISYKHYLAMRKETKTTSNAYIKALIDSKISLINAGWHIGLKDADAVIAKYAKYIKK